MNYFRSFSSTKKSRFLRLLLLSFVLLYTVQGLFATNIQISNIVIVERNDADKYVIVQFDLSWDYSFRVDDATNTNWDAAWLFMKYKKISDTDVQWGHASLNSTGHNIPGNYTSNLATTGGVNKGIFVYPSVVFANTASIPGIRLRWNYGEDGLLSADEVDIKVFGIEMVYVPQGSFYVGSGGDENNHFYTGGSGDVNSTFQIGSSPFQIGNTAGNLWGTGNVTAGNFSPGYPTGYEAFYMMKHNITQQAYVDFLNTLTYAQQDARIDGTPGDAVGAFTNNLNRHKIKILTQGAVGTNPAVYQTENPWVPVNFCTPDDMLAYLDWAALRPYTELEYEKAARGPASPVANEFAWGNTRIGNVLSIANAGLATEAPVATGYQRDITIDHAKVNSDLSNFPVLVRLNAGNFDFNKCMNNGFDIRFYDNSGNVLSYQRERHDFANKLAEYWVKVPSISSTQNTVITMEYGSGSIDGADILNVWDANYLSLWHLNEAGVGAVGEYSDDKAANNGQGFLPFPTQIEGQVGVGQIFAGAGMISIPDDNSLDLVDSVTISGWVKPQILSGITLSEYEAAHWGSNFSVDNVNVVGNTFTAATIPGKATRISSPIALNNIKSVGSSIIDWNGTDGYTVEAFTSNSTFTVPAGVTEIDLLVVAGGGGGGGTIGGGGGAGGLIYNPAYSVTPGAGISVTVGNGGTGGIGYNNAGQTGLSGSNSVFGTITALGGGGGAGWTGYPPTDGGSGGGGTTTHPAGLGTVSQGNDGGTGDVNYGGGGGGAGAVGENGATAGMGTGGDGLDYSAIFGTIYGENGWFAGGGGGGVRGTVTTTQRAGGQGGGGQGQYTHTIQADNALVNTGGGGGGAGYTTATTNQTGGNGGSGIVLVRYKDPNTVKVYTSISNSNTSGYPGVATFTTDGTFTVPAGVTSVEVLVVAGGGAGGDNSSNASATGAGGGGGGGIEYNSSYLVTPGENIAVTVGVGGTVVSNDRGTNGGNSDFGTITSIGGGGGGQRATGDGFDGGSGGGAGYQGNAGAALAAQGYGGGDDFETVPYAGGGGGGAGTVGGNASVNYSGAGGVGLPFTISGLKQYYSGGGAGGAGASAPSGANSSGGIGGGGYGGYAGSINGDDGQANTGGGGGGSGSNGSSAGNGGSGIVIVRWGTEAIQGDTVPSFSVGEDLTGKYLWVMQELSTNNSADAPIFDSIGLEIKSEAVLIGKGEDAYQLSYFDGALKSYINNQQLSSSLTMNTYQHVAVTYNGSFQRIYVNGLLTGTIGLTGNINTNASNLLMGSNMIGELDELRISHSARSQAWLLAEYHSGTGDLVQIGGEAQNTNAVYGAVNFAGVGLGPLRVGFGASPTSSRTAAGSSYWGIMELSGNLWERIVPAGTANGRLFTGLHGDGQITVGGLYDVLNWTNNLPIRGGQWNNPNSDYLRISDRSQTNWNAAWAPRANWQGARGARTAP